MKILFMGTPDFADACLKALVKNKFNVAAVFTKPDKPVGRAQKVVFSQVKQSAIKYNIPVFQPTTLKDDSCKNILEEINPDLIVVVAYGKILPKYILDYPKYKCINIHGSLLPKYRGAAPIQWSVLNGEKQTGVTAMYMDEGMDTGNIILQNKIEIGENETSSELFDRMKTLAADTLIETLNLVKLGKIKSTKQDDTLATYAPMLSKGISKIDFSKSALQVHNKIRGLNSWPSAYTVLNGKKLKIHLSNLSSLKAKNAGVVISLNPFVVGCGDNNSIEIKEVQLEGKKKMSASDFIRGSHLKINDTLG